MFLQEVPSGSIFFTSCFCKIFQEVDISKAPHRRLRYWMHLPQQRELTVDYIYEEQRPFCTHQKGNLLLAEAQVLFSKLATEHRGGPKRPLKLMEVGSHFGDCTLIVHALAKELRWPLHATCFEPVHESAQVFRRSSLGCTFNVRGFIAILLHQTWWNCTWRPGDPTIKQD